MIFSAAPTSADFWMLFTIVMLLIALTGLSLAEMSLSRITKQKAQALLDQNGKRAKIILKLAEDPTKWVNPLLLTVNIFQTVQATLTGIVSGRLFGAPGVAVGVTLNVIVFFVLAEAVPKTYGLVHPVRGATLTAVPVNALTSFYPLRMISQGLIKLTNVIVRGKGLAAGPFISEQEFLGIVEAAAQDAVIEHEERELIESVIEFGDTVVREIMVPRTEMAAIEIHDQMLLACLSNLLDIFGGGHSPSLDTICKCSLLELGSKINVRVTYGSIFHLKAAVQHVHYCHGIMVDAKNVIHIAEDI